MRIYLYMPYDVENHKLSYIHLQILNIPAYRLFSLKIEKKLQHGKYI